MNLIYDFMLDPTYPEARAWAVGDDGVWYTSDLANPDTAHIPTWTNVVTMATFSSLYEPYKTLYANDPDYNPGSGNISYTNECILKFARAIVADPTKEGRFLVTFATNKPDADCPIPIGVTENWGKSWTLHTLGSCGRWNCEFYPGLFGAVRSDVFSGGFAYGSNGQLYWGGSLGHDCCSLWADLEPIATDGSTFPGDTTIIHQVHPLTIPPNNNSDGYYATSIYAARSSSDFLLLGTGADVRLWKNWQLFPVGILGNDASGNLVSLNASDHSLSGIIGIDKTEHTYVIGSTSTPVNWYLYESLNNGNTWTQSGTLPVVNGVGSAYAVYPDKPSYRLAASRLCVNVGGPCYNQPPGTETIAWVSYTGGTTAWTNRTGNWLSVFNNKWAGGLSSSTFITAPSFVRHRKPQLVDDKCNPCNDSNTAQQAQTSIGKPINPSTGDYVYGADDLTLSGRGQPLSFRRTYESFRAKLSDTILGPGWTHNFNSRLIFGTASDGENGTVIFQEASGARQRFFDNGNGTYTSETGLVATMLRSGTSPNYQYTITFHDQTRYLFDAQGRLIQIDTRSNLSGAWNPLLLTYNGNGLLARVTDGTTTGAHYLEFVYDTSNRISEVHDQRRATDPNSPAVHYSYNGSGELATVTDLDNYVWTYSYDQGNHWLTKVTAPAPTSNVVEQQVYDSLGRVTDQGSGNSSTCNTSNPGLIVHLTYQDDVHTVITDGKGNTETYKYDNLGGFAGIDYNSGGPKSTTVVHDTNYRATSQTDGNGNPTSSYTWSPDGQTLTGITDSLGNLTTYTYDSPNVYNRVRQVTDARGNVTKYDYTDPNFPTMPTDKWDGFGTLNLHTHYAYTPEGYLKDITDPKGIITHIDYDSLGQRQRVVMNYVTGTYNPSYPDRDLVTSFIYDGVGRPTEIIDTLGRHSRMTYDNRWHLTKTVRNYVTGTYNPNLPDQDIVTTMSYDGNGRLTGVTDILGRTNTLGYDGQDRVIRSVRNDTGVGYNPANPDRNITTTYSYDLAGNIAIVTDTLGHVNWSCYDSLNRLNRFVQSATGNGGSPSTNPCDAANYVPSHNADRDVITTAAYDANGNTVDTFSYYYDLSSNLQLIRTHFLYDALNRQVAVIRNYQDGIHVFDPNSPSYDPPDRDIISQTFYDKVGNVEHIVDPLGNVTWLCYDQVNRTVRTVVNASQTNPDPNSTGNPCNAGYAASALPDKDIVSTASYDSLSHVVDSVDPLGRHSHYSYDAVERTLSQIANYTGSSYNPANPDRNINTNYVYDGAGRLIENIDVLGHRTHYNYDKLDRQLKAIRNYTGGVYNPAVPDVDVPTSFVYNGVGWLTSQTDPNNNTTTYICDLLDRQTLMTDPLSHATQTAYDGLGNVKSMIDALTHASTFTYDALNRQVSAVTALNFSSQTAYDQLGRSILLTDKNGVKAQYSYDALGRATAVAENYVSGQPINNPTTPDQNVQTTYTYDVLGNLLKMTLPDASAVTFAYDAANRRKSKDGALPGTVDVWTNTYDKGGRTIGNSDPGNRARTMTYDGVDRLTGITYSDPSNPIYTAPVNFTYDGLGRRTRMDDSTGATVFTYDNLDRMLSVTDPLSQIVTYTYDGGGRRTKLTMPGARTITYSYDPADRLITVTNWAGTNNVTTYGYDNANRLTSTILPNGVQAAMGYDNDNRLTSLNYTDSTSQILMNLTYTVDGMGNRLGAGEYLVIPGSGGNPNVIVNPTSTPKSGTVLPTFVPKTATPGAVTPTSDKTPTKSKVTPSTRTPTASAGAVSPNLGGGGGLPSSHQGISYTYDKLYRLLNATYLIINPGQIAYTNKYTYTYDLVGNRRSSAIRKFSGSLPTTTTYSYNQANQLVSSQVNSGAVRNYTYDPAGNLTNDGVNNYAYDAANRLVKYTDSTSAVTNYTYNGQGDRWKRTTSTTATQYLLDLNTTLTQVLSETTSGTATWYVRGLDVIAQQQGSTWSYFHQDGIGSIRQITDASANVGFEASYDPYGTPIERHTDVFNSSLGFTGEQTDANGLVYLRARYLNPSLGAFTSRDPVEGVMGRSITRNAYSYAGANPINYTDHSGKFVPALLLIGTAILASPIILGALLGAGLNAAIAARRYDLTISCGCSNYTKDRGQVIREAAEQGFAYGAVAGGALELGALFGPIGFGVVAFGGGILGIGLAGQNYKNAMQDIAAHGENKCNVFDRDMSGVYALLGLAGAIGGIKASIGPNSTAGGGGSSEGINEGEGDGQSSGEGNTDGSISSGSGPTDWENLYWEGWTERVKGAELDPGTSSRREASNPASDQLKSIVRQLAQVISESPELQNIARAHRRLEFPHDPVWTNEAVGNHVGWAEGNNSSSAALAALDQLNNPGYVNSLGEMGGVPFTRDLAIRWRDFYVSQAYADGANPVAPGRALLMAKIAERMIH